VNGTDVALGDITAVGDVGTLGGAAISDENPS
jgi:hypothetical protein